MAQLPRLNWPQGNIDAKERHHRPLRGTQRSPSVREYLPGDSLRYLHWPTTARRGRLMVTELATEPTSDVWVLLDLDSAGHYLLEEAMAQDGKPSLPVHGYVNDSLEYSIIAAASLASELLNGADRRAVGLFAISDSDAVLVPIQTGQAHLWQILGVLAPVQMGNVSLEQLLRSNREILGRGRSIVVVTAQRDLSWMAELLHLQALGVESSVVWIDGGEAGDNEAGDNEAGREHHGRNVAETLAAYRIPVQVLHLGTPLQMLTTQRRMRKVIRTTPTGGAVVYEIEEEV